MPTYPYRGDFLGDHHRRFGHWRRRVRSGFVAIAGALLGAGIAFLSAPDTTTLTTIGIAAVLGAIVAAAIWQELP